MKNRIVIFIFFFVFVLGTQDAYAYIKPGAGNDLIQIIISAIASIGAFFKNIINKIKSIFKRK